jgi:hypothetical protein
MLCVLSRVDSKINAHGLEKVDKELNILKAFFNRAYKRILENMRQVEKK